MPGNDVRRGEVYLADVAAGGGRLLKERPVLIVQNDVGNEHSRETIVAALRDAHGGRMLPIFVRVPKGVAGVRKECVVDAGHLQTLSQTDLRHKIGDLPADFMDLVDRALEVSLGLEP